MSSKSKFVVAPHIRLHEWVAEEKGYFAAEGLDYEFRETMDSSSGKGITSATRSAPTRPSKPGAPAMSAAPATGR